MKHKLVLALSASAALVCSAGVQAQPSALVDRAVQVSRIDTQPSVESLEEALRLILPLRETDFPTYNKYRELFATRRNALVVVRAKEQQSAARAVQDPVFSAQQRRFLLDERDATAGDAAAMVRLTRHWLNGEGTHFNEQNGIDWAEKALNAGSLGGLRELGDYHLGKGSWRFAREVYQRGEHKSRVPEERRFFQEGAVFAHRVESDILAQFRAHQPTRPASARPTLLDVYAAIFATSIALGYQLGGPNGVAAPADTPIQTERAAQMQKDAAEQFKFSRSLDEIAAKTRREEAEYRARLKP